VHDRVDVPVPPLIDDEDNVQDKLVEFVVTVRLTVPENPFNGDTVIVEIAAVPAVVVTVIGFAVAEKSVNWKIMLVELVVEPLVAVTVAVSVSAVLELQDSVDVPLVPRTMLVEVRLQLAWPVAVTARPTVPVNPARDATVTVEVPPVGPIVVVRLVGLAVRLTPGGGPAAWTVTDIEAVELVIALFVPPVPVIVTEKVCVEVTVPVSVHVVVAVPPAARVTERGLHAAVTPVGVEVEPIATEPANWVPVAPRLVNVTPTWLVPPVVNDTLVVLETMLNPLMRIVSVP
jgi:hypothetical protein